LKKNLGHADSAVRYWGAVGILNRGVAATAASRDELVAALEDESTYVRVVAALALGKFAEEADVRRGVEVLVELSNWSPQMDVFTSMAALNALDKLDGKAAFRVDAIKSLPLGGGASPHGRYNGYVKNLVGKTLSDLGAAPGKKK
jgi:HEAT repeat protein